MHWIFNKILRRHFNLNLDCVVDRVTTIQLVTAVLIAVNLLLLASFVFSRGINTEIQKNTTKTISPNWNFNKIFPFRQKKKYLHLKKTYQTSQFSYQPSGAASIGGSLHVCGGGRRMSVTKLTLTTSNSIRPANQANLAPPKTLIDLPEKVFTHTFYLFIHSLIHSSIQSFIGYSNSHKIHLIWF